MCQLAHLRNDLYALPSVGKRPSSVFPWTYDLIDLITLFTERAFQPCPLTFPQDADLSSLPSLILIAGFDKVLSRCVWDHDWSFLQPMVPNTDWTGGNDQPRLHWSPKKCTCTSDTWFTGATFDNWSHLVWGSLDIVNLTQSYCYCHLSKSRKHRLMKFKHLSGMNSFIDTLIS